MVTAPGRRMALVLSAAAMSRSLGAQEPAPPPLPTVSLPVRAGAASDGAAPTSVATTARSTSAWAVVRQADVAPRGEYESGDAYRARVQTRLLSLPLDAQGFLTLSLKSTRDWPVFRGACEVGVHYDADQGVLVAQFPLYAYAVARSTTDPSDVTGVTAACRTADRGSYAASDAFGVARTVHRAHDERVAVVDGTLDLGRLSDTLGIRVGPAEAKALRPFLGFALLFRPDLGPRGQAAETADRYRTPTIESPYSVRTTTTVMWGDALTLAVYDLRSGRMLSSRKLQARSPLP